MSVAITMRYALLLFRVTFGGTPFVDTSCHSSSLPQFISFAFGVGEN